MQETKRKKPASVCALTVDRKTMAYISEWQIEIQKKNKSPTNNISIIFFFFAQQSRRKKEKNLFRVSVCECGDLAFVSDRQNVSIWFAGWFIKSCAIISTDLTLSMPLLLLLLLFFCRTHMKSHRECHLTPNSRIVFEINGNRKYMNARTEFVWVAFLHIFECERSLFAHSVLFFLLHIFENGEPLRRTGVDWAMKLYRRIIKCKNLWIQTFLFPLVSFIIGSNESERDRD